eukprot:90606-Amphidinium_carterae.1
MQRFREKTTVLFIASQTEAIVQMRCDAGKAHQHMMIHLQRAVACNWMSVRFPEQLIVKLCGMFRWVQLEPLNIITSVPLQGMPSRSRHDVYIA